MIPLTVPEVRCLLRALGGTPEQQEHHLRWSYWRRAHQATARRCHAARRVRKHPPPAARAPVVVAVPGTPALADVLWARLAPLLPPRAKRGRPAGDHRPVLGRLLQLMRTGADWREIPAEFGPWQTLYSRYQLWRRNGTWARLVAALQQPAPAAGVPG